MIKILFAGALALLPVPAFAQRTPKPQVPRSDARAPQLCIIRIPGERPFYAFTSPHPEQAPNNVSPTGRERPCPQQFVEEAQRLVRQGR